MKQQKLPFGLLLIFALIIGLQSCKYDCPGFPNSESIWIPHQEGDVLKYFSESDTIEYEVIENFKSGPSDFRGLVMDYDCDYEGYYLTNSKNDGLKIKERITAFKGMEVELSDNDKFEFSLYFGDSETDDCKTKFYADTIIKATDYQNVFMINKKNTISEYRIDWIIKAENEGVIQYHDKTTDRTWTKIID